MSNQRTLSDAVKVTARMMLALLLFRLGDLDPTSWHSRIRIASTLFSITFALAVTAVSAEEGTWIADENFAQVNVACSRVYTCVTGQDILHSDDTKVVTSGKKLVWGVCSADSKRRSNNASEERPDLPVAPPE